MTAAEAKMSGHIYCGTAAQVGKEETASLLHGRYNAIWCPPRNLIPPKPGDKLWLVWRKGRGDPVCLLGCGRVTESHTKFGSNVLWTNADEECRGVLQEARRLGYRGPDNMAFLRLRDIEPPARGYPIAQGMDPARNGLTDATPEQAAILDALLSKPGASNLSAHATLGGASAGKWTLAEGDTLGGYRVIKPIGRGGMGEVYLVEHVAMGKRYAMKLLSAAHSRDTSFRDRFKVEARLMADLEHPGIVRVHNMGEEGGRYFLVMDYVEAASGEPVTLDDLIGKRKLGETEARSLAIGIARALDYAHSYSEGVVHRDLKPGNVLIGADGRVRVSDFGLAKVMGEAYIRSVLDKSVNLSVAPTVARDGGAGSPGITQSDGAVLGTFEFMAPEQKEGRADARSDIYSLGLIIYRMLTDKRAEGRFPDPSKLGLSAWWDGVIEKTLAPDPDDRYLSAKELLADLEGARAKGPRRRAVAGPRLPLSRRVLIVLGAAAGVVVFAGLVAFYSLSTLHPVDPPLPPPPINPTDLAPQARLTRAPEGSLADPSATLELEIEASDDRGLQEVGLLHVVRGKPTRVVLSRPRRGQRRSNVHYWFRLAALGLREGETVTYYAYAIDDDAGGPKEGQSRARRVKIESPRAGDEAAWLATKREAEARAARGDYQGALGIIKRFLDTAKTIKFKPQAVGLWGEIEQKRLEEERRRGGQGQGQGGTVPTTPHALAKEQVDRAIDAVLDPSEPSRRLAEKQVDRAIDAALLPPARPSYRWEARGRVELGGHRGAVQAVAFSPDGSYLATAGADGTAVLWQVSTGTRLRTLTGHKAAVLSVAFSPDGRHLATGSDDRTAALWDARTGGRLKTIEGHGGDVYSVAFSPDGRFLATGSDSNTAALWDVSTGMRRRTFGGHTRDVKAIAFSADGRFLATGSDDSTAALWNVSTGARLRTLRGHRRAVRAVAFSPGGRYVATGSYDETFVLWDVATGGKLKTFGGHRDEVNSVAFSPDGRYLATASNDNDAALWDISAGVRLVTFEGHGSDVSSVAFSPGGRCIATGSEDRTARIWLLPKQYRPKGK
ncbi:MAG: protein kinase domain-containing protein [Planctomycetota bacterium]|jgi:WD40 repeat protein/serine/threonine protein kinase